jgi:acyl carrier protein
MTRPDIESTVRGVLETALGRDIAPEENVVREQEAGWDSVKHIEVLFMIEEELGITFEPEEMAELDGLRAIVDRAAAHLAAS